MQFLCYLLAHALDSAHGLAIEFLRRELDGGVTGVYTGKLDMFRNGVSDNLAVACHCVHLHLLGMLDELAYHHGVILTHVGSQFKELLKLLLI